MEMDNEICATFRDDQSNSDFVINSCKMYQLSMPATIT